MPHRKSQRRGAQRACSREFFEKHSDLIAALFTAPTRTRPATLQDLARGKVAPASGSFSAAVHRLKATGFSLLLRAAEAENNPEAFKELLELLLDFLGVKTPKGVFTPAAKTGKPGRPMTSENEQILSTWNKIGKPSLHKNELAWEIFGPTFTRASGTDRRRMRDKCRRAVERHFEREADNLEREADKLEKELADEKKAIADLRQQLVRVEGQLAEAKAVSRKPPKN